MDAFRWIVPACLRIAGALAMVAAFDGLLGGGASDAHIQTWLLVSIALTLMGRQEGSS